LEPKDAALRALVDGLSHRDRRNRALRKGFVGVAAALAISGVAFGGLKLQRRRQARISALVSTTQPPSRPGTKAPDPRHPTRVMPPVAGPAPVLHQHLPRPNAPAAPPPVAAPPRTFELAPTPKAVSVWLDGKPLGDYGPELAQLEVSP